MYAFYTHTSLEWERDTASYLFARFLLPEQKVVFDLFTRTDPDNMKPTIFYEKKLLEGQDSIAPAKKKNVPEEVPRNSTLLTHTPIKANTPRQQATDGLSQEEKKKNTER